MAYKKVRNIAHRRGWLLSRLTQLKEYQQAVENLKEEILNDLAAYGPATGANEDAYTAEVINEINEVL